MENDGADMANLDLAQSFARTGLEMKEAAG